jgi:capsule polysaccharide export protein KpsC/LpsZ
LVRFANNHPEFNLIVKPHPKDMGSPVLNSIKQKYDIKNFHLLETSVSPLHCINAADVVITKSSGTGFEAFLMDTPVISIVLDDDRWFAQYGNAAEQFRKTESLCELLDDLLNDPEKREQWFNQVDDQIETFVTRNLLVTNDPNKRIADSIESAVRDDATEEGNHKN